MEDNEQIQNKTNEQSSSQRSIDEFTTKLKTQIKAVLSSIKVSLMEDIPVNSEQDSKTKDERPDGVIYNKYGRTRFGGTSGLYFNSNPHLLDDGGFIKS